MAGQSWTCAYCGDKVGAKAEHSIGIWPYQGPLNSNVIHYESFEHIVICPGCSRVSLITAEGAVLPPVRRALDVKNMPDDLAHTWAEARRAFSVAAYTASELMCRKILMHLAVDLEAAAEGLRFIEYVDLLVERGHVIKKMKPVVDQVRTRGNRATHDLASSSEADAAQTLEVTDYILRGIYEVSAVQP